MRSGQHKEQELSTMELKSVEQCINKEKIENIDYDENFEGISKRNISNRDDSYTALLKHFVEITKRRNIIKEVHKWVYFWLIMILTGTFVVFMFILLDKVDFSSDNYSDILIVTVSSMLSFCSVIISIPLIITKYLFSSKEDKRISKIILHTQQHDINGKKILEEIMGTSSKSKDIVELISQKVRMDSNLSEKDNPEEKMG